MDTLYHLSASNEIEVWQQINKALAETPFTYNAVIQQEQTTTIITIDVDPGSGFAGGYSFTNFSAQLPANTDFRFALHHQGFLDEIGKFFGMQDVLIGYPDFDEKVIVKSNDEAKVKALFSDGALRNPWINLTNFNLHITGSSEAESGSLLKLEIDEGITNAETLKQLYESFYKILISHSTNGDDASNL